MKEAKKLGSGCTVSTNILACVLTIVFVALKCTGEISWSWLWVLSPLWIHLAFWLVVLLACFLVIGLATVFGDL